MRPSLWEWGLDLISSGTAIGRGRRVMGPRWLAPVAMGAGRLRYRTGRTATAIAARRQRPNSIGHEVVATEGLLATFSRRSKEIWWQAAYHLSGDRTKH